MKKNPSHDNLFSHAGENLVFRSVRSYSYTCPTSQIDGSVPRKRTRILFPPPRIKKKKKNRRYILVNGHLSGQILPGIFSPIDPNRVAFFLYLNLLYGHPVGWKAFNALVKVKFVDFFFIPSLNTR